jgi:hypothetical protein
MVGTDEQTLTGWPSRLLLCSRTEPAASIAALLTLLCATRRIEYKKLLNLRGDLPLNTDHVMKKLLITIGLAVVAGVTAHAGGHYSFYGSNGQYLGNAYSNNGYTSYYGGNGQYLGNSYQYNNGNLGSTSFYGGNGQYLGKSYRYGWGQ